MLLCSVPAFSYKHCPCRYGTSASSLSNTVTGSATAYTQLYPQVYGAALSGHLALTALHDVCRCPPSLKSMAARYMAGRAANVVMPCCFQVPPHLPCMVPQLSLAPLV